MGKPKTNEITVCTKTKKEHFFFLTLIVYAQHFYRKIKRQKKEPTYADVIKLLKEKILELEKDQRKKHIDLVHWYKPNK